MKNFTLEELKEYNGKDGAKTFVAYKGKIYDLTPSSHWHSGKHAGREMGGTDVTEIISQSPHGDKVLEKYEVVGILVN